MRRAVRSAAFAVVTCLVLAAPFAGIAAAGQGDGSGQGSGQGGSQGEVLATLRVENPNVEVKPAGEDEFAPATDGQKLRKGDTVRTDATGRAEVDYSDDAYTRLDVNTTFKIEELSEEQGQRKVKGGLETGRTWNRTEAVTESGSFEQSGAGATAAVAGTAFAMTCTVDGSNAECRYQAIVHDIILTGEGGQQQHMTPLTGCVAENGQLCSELTHLTPEELAANAWIQENLLRDLLERGYGPGPFVVGGTLVVQDGVVTFTEEPVPTGETTPTTTPDAVKPAIDNPPIECDIVYGSGDDCTYAANTSELAPTNQIIIYEGDSVVFRVRIVDNGAPGPVSVVFDAIPLDLGSFCLSDDTIENYCGEAGLQTGTEYPADVYFVFNASYCGGGCDGDLVFHLEGPSGNSPSVTVPIIVCSYYGCGSEEIGDGALANQATAPRGRTNPPSAPDSTTSTTNGGVPVTRGTTPTTTETAPPTTVAGDSTGSR